MFEPNTKVVCVDDNFPPDIKDIMNALPRKGTIYTVRDIVPGQNWDLTETIAIYLVELVNRPNMHGFEPGFSSHRFTEPEHLDETNSVKEEEPIFAGF